MSISDIESVGYVIIGGGILGVSVAAHLAKSGVRDVFLLEKNRKLGMNETAASAAMISLNTLEPDRMRIRLAAQAMKAHERLMGVFGIDSEITRCGSLLLSTTPEGRVFMEKHVKIQNDYGIPTVLYTREQIRERFPILEGDDITAGIYCPVDGHVDQMALVSKLGQYAKSHGVTILTDTTVTDIKRETNGDFGVETNSRGLYPAKQVIIAAGADSPHMSAIFGRSDLSLTYAARTLWDGVPRQYQSIPNFEFIDGPDKDFYIRSTPDRRYIIAYGPTRDSDHYPTEPIPSFGREKTKEFLAQRLPGLGIGELTGNVGIRTMTPDGIPYIGPIDRESRVFAAYGGSGYGITNSIVLGEALAEQISEGKISREREYLLPTHERFVRSEGIERIGFEG